MDLNLRQLLRAENPEEQRLLIENLFSSQIEPLVKKTIRIKFTPNLGTKHDEEDISSEALLRLWKQLQKWLQNPGQAEITNLPAYVATTTVNCCKEYFRNKFPRRWHLRNRLRYLLTHSQQFAIWKSEQGDWLTGYPAWKERQQVDQDAVTKLMQHAEVFRSANREKGNLEKIVRVIFRNAQGPVTLDDLHAIVIALPGIREQYQDVKMENESEVERLPNPGSNLKIITEKSAYLERLWSEICGLPPNQRTALLLNLRDGEGRDAITSFPATGTANIPQIAEALGMSGQELAHLWNDLPLDDERIAERLKLSRQQVINLRKSARERLAYRMRK